MTDLAKGLVLRLFTGRFLGYLHCLAFVLSMTTIVGEDIAMSAVDSVAAAPVLALNVRRCPSAGARCSSSMTRRGRANPCG